MRIHKTEILNKCEKTKVFNFLLRKNLALVYFEEDANLLYGILEISASDLINKFASYVLGQKNLLVKGVIGSGSNQKLSPSSLEAEKKILAKKAEGFLTKLEKRLSLIPTYPRLTDYLQDQADFEVIASIHNGRERILYFIDTRSLPVVLTVKNSKNKNSERLVFKFEG